jgi:ABC-type Zn uptake system ZnuABC Zn-binding protein ZnuA
LLDRQVRKIFVPINFKKILTFDSPLLYFFKRYRVPMVNNLQSNKIGQMSVDELTKQIEEVKSKEIKAIVWNRQLSNQKNVSFFADKCGIIPDEISIPKSREKLQYTSLILFIAKRVAAL